MPFRCHVVDIYQMPQKKTSFKCHMKDYFRCKDIKMACPHHVTTTTLQQAKSEILLQLRRQCQINGKQSHINTDRSANFPVQSELYVLCRNTIPYTCYTQVNFTSESLQRKITIHYTAIICPIVNAEHLIHGCLKLIKEIKKKIKSNERHPLDAYHNRYNSKS